MKKAILLAAMLGSAVAMADDIYLGNPTYGGSGCPQGSASALLSPDQKTLSILFDRFTAQSGYPTQLTVDRKTCDIGIPVHVPQGYSIALFQMDYRGYNALPHNATSKFRVEYFFAGQRGPVVERSFSGYQSQDFTISNNVIGQALVWSPCGKDVNLRVNTSMVATTNQRREQTMASVDSADIKAGLIYHLQWKRCN